MSSPVPEDATLDELRTAVEELREANDDLRDRNDDLEQQLRGLREDVGGLQLIVRELLGVDADEYDHVHELRGDASSIRNDLDRQRRLITKVSKQLDSFGELSTEQSTKTEKIAAIRQYAQNVSNGDGPVELGCKDIVAATGVSRRYAYDLMDPDEGLPAECSWAEFRPAEDRLVGPVNNQKRKRQPKSLLVDVGEFTPSEGV